MLKTIMRTTWLPLLIVFGVCLVAAAGAYAQPLIDHAQSIESMVANADLVFIAKLEKFGDGDRADGPKCTRQREAALNAVLQGTWVLLAP